MEARMIGERRVIGVIPARAGSQRLPGKNVRPMAGRPMIGWTLEAARASAVLDRVVVTSDDEAVLGIGRDAGVDVIRRPDHLAGPDASVIDATRHALDAIGGHWDYVVLLQPTSPLRTAADINAAVSLCDKNNAPAVLTVSPLPKPEAFYDQLDVDGALAGPPALEGAVLINGAIYVGRPERLFLDGTFRCSGALGSLMPVERGWDVDTLEEFLSCEAYFASTNRGIL
jgi:CMP-N,N'-diacetyllegionaminic acid synthase